MEQRLRRKRLSVAVSFQERTYVEEEHDGEEGPGQKENVPPKPRNAKPNVCFDRRKSVVQFKENDDAVEKRNRRKSRIMMEEALGGSPLSPQKGKAAPPRQSLAAGGGGLLRRKSLLPRIHLPKTQLIELYSECIRLSAENKINQKNSWSLDLIDHIDDVLQSNFNNEEGSGVGNFQAASCTLDASVKIYSYRVDSIHNETYRVLGDLSLTRNGKKSKHDDADEGADEEGNEGQGQGKKGAGARRKRRARVDTIEKNPASLLVEELGFGLGLDPLFRKLSSGFDENGAQGLLLNQLPINRHAEVVLDSTATFMSSNDVDSAEDEESEGGSSAHGFCSLPADLVRSLQRSLRDAAVLCPPLSEQQPDEADDQEEFDPVAFELDPSEADAHSDTHDNPSAGEGEGLLRTLGLHSLAPIAPDLADHDPNAWGDDVGDDGAEASLDDSHIGSDAFHSNPPLERIAGELGGLGVGAKGLRDGEGGGALASDLASLVGTLQMGASGWAGPSHWKYKPAKAVVVRAKTETGQENGKEEEEEVEEEEERVSAKKGKKKAAFFIDFSAPPIDTKVAFATTRAATTLSQAVLKKAKEEDYLLPRDVKYDYRALCSYFLHPTRTIGSPLVSSALLGGAALYSSIAGTQPLDALATATHEDVNMDVDMDMDMDMDIGGSDVDDVEENYVAEADPHAANDDPPDPHALDAAATGEAGEDKLELVEQPRKVNSEAISYARVAKKIDVIALKRALSHQITSSSAQPQEKEGVSFKNLLHKLPSRIKDRRTLEDLSVCFITLLHLANEHDFEITAASLGGPNDDEDDDDDEDDRDSLAYPTDYLVHVPERQ